MNRKQKRQRHPKTITGMLLQYYGYSKHIGHIGKGRKIKQLQQILLPDGSVKQIAHFSVKQ